MIILDTDFLVDLLLGEPNAVAKAEELDERGGFVTTSINVDEVYHVVNFAFRGSDLKPIRETLISKAQALFNSLPILSLDASIAPDDIETIYMFTLDKRGNSSDSFIAQLALRMKVEMIVTNTDAFNRLSYIKTENY
jgi:predicted nucleic acid-binding protein